MNIIHELYIFSIVFLNVLLLNISATINNFNKFPEKLNFILIIKLKIFYTQIFLSILFYKISIKYYYKYFEHKRKPNNILFTFKTPTETNPKHLYKIFFGKWRRFTRFSTSRSTLFIADIGVDLSIHSLQKQMRF